MARGKNRTELERIGTSTQFRKGDGRARAMARKSVETRKARAVLRSSDYILEADRNGTLSKVVDNVLKALDELYKKKSYDSFIKHSLSLLELVNGRQIKLETSLETPRPVNIIFRKATLEDSK